MKVTNYLSYTLRREKELSDALTAVSMKHKAEPDVHTMCMLLSCWSDSHVKDLEILNDRFGDEEEKESARFDYPSLKTRQGGMGLLRDFHDLWLIASEVKLCWTVLIQCSKALRDEQMHLTCIKCGSETKRQCDWFLNRIKTGASQALTVPV